MTPTLRDAAEALPLAGLSVVDATADFTGAMCGRLLADAGANVTRIGAPVRSESDGISFADLGKDSRIQTADAASALATADVLLTSGGDGTSTPSPAAGRPLLVTIPAFGSGRYQHYRGGEVVLAALCGLADCSPGYPDWQEGDIQPPVQSQARLAEFGAALIAAIAVLGALLGRRRGSSDVHVIEVSQLEAAVSLMVFDWGPAAYAGDAPGRRRSGRLLEPNMFVRCRDGYVVIVATNDSQWTALVDAMGSPSWALSPHFATILSRAEHKDKLHAAIREWATTNSGRELAGRAQVAGLPCAFVLTLEEAVSSDQVKSLGSFETLNGSRLPADPVVVDGQRRTGRYVRAATAGRFELPDRSGHKPPLEGVRVLDVSQLIAGPMVGQFLAALGADVVIVESRRYPTPRMYGPFAGDPQHDSSANFNHANRGKRSVELDLKTDDGKRLFRRLVTKADLVVENFSRRAAADLGLSYPELRALRADVILASISAFGRSGPWGAYTANHAGVAALSGLAAATPGPDGEPHLAGAIMPDVLTGAYMAVAVLEALIDRERTGRGAHVEVNMLEVSFNTMGDIVARTDRDRRSPACFIESEERGRYMSVERNAYNDGLGRALDGVSAADAAAALQVRGIAAAPVQSMLDVLQDPHLRSREFVEWLEHPVVGRRPLPGVPWTFDGRRPPLGVAPMLGSDTDRVMRDLLRLTPAEIQELRASGVLR